LRFAFDLCDRHAFSARASFSALICVALFGLAGVEGARFPGPENVRLAGGAIAGAGGAGGRQESTHSVTVAAVDGSPPTRAS
jgi:hypothetical protein